MVNLISFGFQISNPRLDPLSSIVDAGDPLPTTSLIGSSRFQLGEARLDGLDGNRFSLDISK